MNRIIVALFLTSALYVIGCNAMPAPQPTSSAAVNSQAPAVDLQNTICPVEGDKVGDSKLTETYEGKIYHFCCNDCPPKFKKGPKKYADAVAADPAKFGVK